MSNIQYEIEFEIEFEKNIHDYYQDQASNSTEFADRKINSFYTPHGIKCIDSQYAVLIQNMHQCATLYTIERDLDSGLYDYIETYKLVPPDYNSRYAGYGFRVVYDNGYTKDFFYGQGPIFDSVTRKIDIKQLINDIKNDIHLHVKIKENLLQNIENYEKN